MITGKIESPALINDLWQVCYDSGELAGAATSVTISGLTGDTDIEYYLMMRLINGYNGALGINTRPNNVSTADNYGYQYLNGGDTTASAGRGTATGLINLGQSSALSQISLGYQIIYAKSGYVRTAIGKQAHSISGTTVAAIQALGLSWNNTADEITSLVITANQADGLGIGSRIILLKKVADTTHLQTGSLEVRGSIYGTWEQIYETDISSDVSSLTISSLTGNTDILYRLICRFVPKSGVNPDNHALTFNGDTGSNYGNQHLLGSHTDVYALRDAQTNIGMTWGSTDDRSMADVIIYAKSGYVRTAIVEGVRGVTGTTVTQLILRGYSWNNTADEITSMVITTATNGIGVGSHIELWRLNL